MRRLWQWPRLRWQEAWAAMRAHPWRVTLIAAPWLLGLLTVVPMLWYEMDRAVRLPERQAAQDALENAAQSMLRRLGRLRDDTRFIAFLTPRLLESGSEAQLLETYTSFLMAGRDYHKVRWMDATGQERLRVDQEGGSILRVPGGALQDKRGRPFFENALLLQPGEIHLSPLDLNFENGRIEQPLRPTLRASSPFVLADGTKGVAVVNLHGSVLLKRLRDRASQSGFSLYLVHPDGYWLLGPTPGEAWGWQLGHAEHTVATFDPALWAAMQRRPSGSWQDWSFSTLQAAWRGTEGDLLAHADPTVGQLRLLVHRSRPPASRWKVVLGGLALLGGGVVLWLVLAQAGGMARERAYMQRLRDCRPPRRNWRAPSACLRWG